MIVFQFLNLNYQKLNFNQLPLLLFHVNQTMNLINNQIFFSSQQVQPTIIPVVQITTKGFNPNIEEVDKKRVRKEKPKEPARQVKEPLRKVEKIDSVQDTTKQNKQQFYSKEEVDMIQNLSDFVSKDKKNLKVIQPEKEIIDITSFVNEIPTTIVESQGDMKQNQYTLVQFKSDQNAIEKQNSQNNHDNQLDSDKGAYTEPEDFEDQNDEQQKNDTIDSEDELPIQNKCIHTIQEKTFKDTNQEKKNQFC